MVKRHFTFNCLRSLVASSQNSTSELSNNINNISDTTQAGNQTIELALQNSTFHSSVIISKRPVSESVSDDYASNSHESVTVGTLANSTKISVVKNDTSGQQPFAVRKYHEPVVPVVRNENLKTKAEQVRDRILSSGYNNRTSSSSFSNPTVEQTPNESNQEQKSSELLITGPVHGKDIPTPSSQDRPETKASYTGRRNTR
jgi:hypothetical protein